MPTLYILTILQVLGEKEIEGIQKTGIVWKHVWILYIQNVNEGDTKTENNNNKKSNRTSNK